MQPSTNLLERCDRIAAHAPQVAGVIFMFALLLRVGAALTLPEEILWDDGFRYQKVALNLVNTHGFGSIEDNTNSVPTQPLLIAASYLAFGDNILALRLLMAVIGAMVCVTAYAIGKNFSGPLVGALAGLILACYPPYIYLSTLFEYPQGFFVLMVSSCFLGLLAFDTSQHMKALLLAGICYGIAMLSVTAVLLFLPFIFVWLLLNASSNSKALAACMVFLLGTLVPIGSWTARNHSAYGHFIPFNTAGGFSFWLANNETYFNYGKAAVVLRNQGPNDPTDEFNNQVDEIHETVSRLNPIERALEFDRLAWQRGLDFVRNNPDKFLKLTARKFVDLWSPYPDAVSKSGQISAVKTFIAVATYLPLLLLAILGLVLTQKEWRRYMLIYGYVVALTGAYIIFLPNMRYRLPIDFFLALLASHALVHFFRKWSLRNP